MIEITRQPLSNEEIKAKAREFGADLVGIADGKVMNEHPPDPAHPRRPKDLTDLDGDTVIVLAKRIFAGTSKILAWNDRHKFYNDEIALSRLEEASLELVYWLEQQGYPAIIVPPTHTDPWRYGGNPASHRETLLSLTHAAVEAGLGTLGLNLQLLTPEFGPRVILSAVLCSATVEPDRRMEKALCLGPECGRCLRSCPGNVIRHWDRDWEGCDRYRQPYGFGKFAEHLAGVVNESDPARQREMIRSEDTFYLWQSILRGAGAITGCRNCQDVCPVGRDYEMHLKEARERIPEDTPQKQAALAEMIKTEQTGLLPESYAAQARWIGTLSQRVDSGPPRGKQD
jgi:ferredoxin